MATMLDVGAERRYQQLRKRLDALHYSQPLSKSLVFSPL